MMSESATQCYRKYESLVALASVLESTVPSDDGWSVVVRFYAALHLMNTYLLDKGNVSLKLASTAHDDRKKAMAKCPELRDAPASHRALKELSEDIRYSPEFEFALQHQEASKKLLAKIIAIVDPKIKKN